MNNFAILCDMENLSSLKFLITCEHATNRVPDNYRHLFSDAGDDLQSHRGWDPGAFIIAHTIQKAVHAPVLSFPFTRLLIDPNRSLHHPRLFSDFTKQLPKREKNNLINSLYLPYRENAEEALSEIASQAEQVVHLSIHTFTPSLNGRERAFDIGLLYDPSRKAEKQFCSKWKHALQHENSVLRIKMNQPYKGKSDGFTTYLRHRLGVQYVGIELEVNQKHYFDGGQHWVSMCRMISDSLLHIQI